MKKTLLPILIVGIIAVTVFYGGYLQEDPVQRQPNMSTPTGPVKQKVSVLIYTLKSCRYCTLAKDLLRQKGVQFKEIDVASPEIAREVRALTGRTSVPQIFINGQHIGGYSELRESDQAGELDKYLLGVADAKGSGDQQDTDE